MRYIGVILLLGLLVVFPVQAFTADTLEITLQPTGDAQIRFDYTLNWIEQFAVFLRIADPSEELRKAFENNLKTPVSVSGVTSSSMSLGVVKFASVSQKDGVTTLQTPALSFREAERLLNQYWFAPLVNPDFSPATTRVIFPDGYTETFPNQDSIPRLIHTLP